MATDIVPHLLKILDKYTQVHFIKSYWSWNIECFLNERQWQDSFHCGQQKVIMRSSPFQRPPLVHGLKFWISIEEISFVFTLLYNNHNLTLFMALPLGTIHCNNLLIDQDNVGSQSFFFFDKFFYKNTKQLIWNWLNVIGSHDASKRLEISLTYISNGVSLRSYHSACPWLLYRMSHQLSTELTLVEDPFSIACQMLL